MLKINPDGETVDIPLIPLEAYKKAYGFVSHRKGPELVRLKRRLRGSAVEGRLPLEDSTLITNTALNVLGFLRDRAEHLGDVAGEHEARRHMDGLRRFQRLLDKLKAHLEYHA